MIKIVVFDLDGTLLNNRKEMTERTKEALCRAADAGIILVPATGRLYFALPPALKELPFIRYVIESNGAQVQDTAAKEMLYCRQIAMKDAEGIYDFLDQYPELCYDCYQDDKGWMDRVFWERLDQVVLDPFLLETARKYHQPIEHFRKEMTGRNRPLQKIQFYTKNMELREKLLRDLPGIFPEMQISTSLPVNAEINHGEANKGAALAALCRHLQIPLKDCMAVGDGTNDLSMIRMAGCGVAMGNAAPEVAAAADCMTKSNEEDGVAVLLEKLLKNGSV